MSQPRSMHISIHRTLSEGDVSRFLPVYREAFSPFDSLSAVRQALTDEEFAHEMVDPGVLKLLGVDEHGQAVAMAALTDDLEKVPWINAAYYHHHFPDYYERKAIYYFFTLLVRKEAQGGPWVVAMIETLAMLMTAAKGMVAFDCCRYNVDELKVPDLIRGITDRFAHLVWHEIDAQHYYTMEVPAMKHIDLRDKRDHGVTIDLRIPPKPTEAPTTREVNQP